MIRRPLVLVLGAGASHEYGLPLGHALKQDVAEAVRFRFGRFGSDLIGGNPDLLDILRMLYGKGVNDYTRAGNAVYDASLAQPSIDQTLFFLSDNEAAITVGKLGIAQQILQAESKSSLGQGRSQSLDAFPLNTARWMFHLLTLIVSNSAPGDLPNLLSNLTIVNFNYDRSLEHYLYFAIQRSCRVPSEQAAEMMMNLKVVRPYGSVGPLAWQATNSIDYGVDGVHPQVVVRASESIRTYTESLNSDIKADILEAIGGAFSVLFLGFGYHRQNMEVLHGASMSDEAASKGAVFATTQGFHSDVIADLRRRIGDVTRADMSLYSPQMTCAEIFSNLHPLISAAVDP